MLWQFVLLIFYRNLKLRIGEESWSDEAEKLYQKIARGEQLTEEDNKIVIYSSLHLNSG